MYDGGKVPPRDGTSGSGGLDSAVGVACDDVLVIGYGGALGITFDVTSATGSYNGSELGGTYCGGVFVCAAYDDTS